MFRKSPTPVGDGAFRRLAQKVDLELLARLAEADCNGRTGAFDCSAMVLVPGTCARARGRARSTKAAGAWPASAGLGVSPGPGMGLILKEIYERQLDGAVTSLDEGVALARELIIRGRPDFLRQLRRPWF
jgi:hypothetical protein